MKNVYYLHNSYHLGDNIYNLIVFYIIKEQVHIIITIDLAN